MGKIYLIDGGLADETLKDNPTSPLNQGRDYLNAYGHDAEVAYDLPEAMKLLNSAVPDVLVVSLFVWPKDAFELIAELKRLYPSATTQVACIMSPEATTGGFPLIMWKREAFASFILRPYTCWDVVLTAEQLFYRRIAVAPDTISELRLRQLARDLTFCARSHDNKFPNIESLAQLKPLLFEEDKFYLKEEDFVQPGTSTLYGVNRALSLLSIFEPPKSRLAIFHRSEKVAVVPQGEDIIAFYEREPGPDGTRMVAFVRWNYPEVEVPARRVGEAEWQHLISNSLFRE